LENIMQKREVRSPADALAYLVDCQLATVCHVVGKRSSAKCDIERHICIAQSGVNWMREYNVSPGGTRAEDVLRLFDGSVESWSHRFKA
jgi:hypothetical protein